MMNSATAGTAAYQPLCDSHPSTDEGMCGSINNFRLSIYMLSASEKQHMSRKHMFTVRTRFELESGGAFPIKYTTF